MPADGIWRFNFAPGSAPDVESFITIGVDTDYHGWRGYGWLDAEGPIKAGKWPGDEQKTWESRSNLNVVNRRGPDDLARSHATGPATFALDLAPGKYEVWVLSGDSGHLEYIPREPYRIIVEGKTAFEFGISAGEFIKEFETPALEDELSQSDVWRHAIEPRFKWSRIVVEVEDGQLTVNVASNKRDSSVSDFTGDYAHTEARSGPPVRFTGALNAMLVLPATPDASVGVQTVNAIDDWRQQNISRNWKRIDTESEPFASFTKADRERGYTVFPVNALSPVMPDDQQSHAETVIKLRATPGEYVPITFAITPLKDLGETRVDFNTLHGLSDTANKTLSTEGNLVSGVVRYHASPIDKQRKVWRPGPAMVVPTSQWNIREGVSKQFWLTYRVPDEMSPGLYTGAIEINPEHAAGTRLAVELQVLPFKLQRPKQLAIGMTYFSPAQYAATGDTDFWLRMQAEFADMRAHNMTTIQYTGIRMDDYDRFGRALALYRNAGFEQPITVLESHGTMWRLRRNGIPWTSGEFHTRYVKFIRDFLEQAQLRQWPPIIINFGDEFTNTAMEEFGADVARHLKEIPGIVTSADANGYKEVELMAPEVDIVAFNKGWDGPEGVNEGKQLLNKGTVDLILNAGATPWLVNIGMDRFSNGYWFWKMIRLGVRGKMEWIYRSYNGMPFNTFDAEPLRAHAVYPGPDGTAIPSLDYEWMRMGLDDLAYLYTLEQVVASSRGDPEKALAVTAAEAFIHKLDSMIEDDMNKYRDHATRDSHRWPVKRYDEVRGEVVELILRLYKPQDVH
jgi:hypothetical protein